jgi:uncharacterized membrane protein
MGAGALDLRCPASAPTLGIMADHERSHPVESDASTVYALLSDVENLPRYFPQITSAHPVGDGDAVDTTAVIDPPDQPEREVRGEAWFRTDVAARRIEWGAEGESDYSGALTVQENGTGSTVVLSLHTPHEHEGIEESIDQVLERIDALL